MAATIKSSKQFSSFLSMAIGIYFDSAEFFWPHSPSYWKPIPTTCVSFYRANNQARFNLLHGILHVVQIFPKGLQYS